MEAGGDAADAPHACVKINAGKQQMGQEVFRVGGGVCVARCHVLLLTVDPLCCLLFHLELKQLLRCFFTDVQQNGRLHDTARHSVSIWCPKASVRQQHSSSLRQCFRSTGVSNANRTHKIHRSSRANQRCVGSNVEKLTLIYCRIVAKFFIFNSLFIRKLPYLIAQIILSITV